ncbi:non-green plastid inner envelope membrane protein [Musa troglodytarum]|uniref:Non-green plastid inner envelope membrane protein n=1 Tax=Musa troglodytarum TaxID=320322 RepID=A0A9E7JG26_9LILI|nr:non-green plastid inner envelope membrane protein [Musa troglodytarum]
MPAAIHGFVSLRNPNPHLNGIRASSSSFSSTIPLGTARRLMGSAHPPLSHRDLGARLRYLDRRTSKIPFVASREEPVSHIELQKEMTDAELKAAVSHEAWQEALKHFKTEAMKVKAVSEAYQVYTKKAMEILTDTSEKLKIQAEKAQRDLNLIAKEVSEQGKEYLSTATKNSPDSVREIFETYASANELNMSSIRDFYLGIPYGSFLSIGGFIYFILTGSIPAIRFGVVLGSIIFALSVSSMRSWKNGKATPLLLIGQTAISAIIFFRQCLLCSQRGSFPNLLMLLISGSMVGFYIYRMVIDGHKARPSVEQRSEN